MEKIRFTTLTKLHPKTKKTTNNKYIMAFVGNTMKGNWKRVYSDKKGDYIIYKTKKYRLN